MRNPRFWLIALVTCLLVVSATVGAVPKENVVKLPYSDRITSFVPYYWQSQHILAQGTIFEGLFGYAPDPNGLGGVKVVPVIAEKWICSEDGKTWTITLRKDKKWSNGDPITAHDFEWTYKYICSPDIPDVPLWANHLQHVKNGWTCKAGGAPLDELGVKALDDYTIQFILDNSRYDFNCWLVVAGSVPLHRATVEKYGEMEWWKPENFVGNGPYVPISWTDREEAVLVKNKNYVGECGNVDRFILKNFAPGASHIQAYQAGEIDLAWIYGSSGAIGDYKYVQRNKTLKNAYRETPGDLTWSGYQVTRGFKSDVLDDIRVRQAFALAIDRKTLAEKVLEGRAFPSNKFWADNDPIGSRMIGVEDNVAKAKKLLAEAGYPGGKGLPQLRFYISGNMPEVEYIVDQWKKNLGVTVLIENIENAVYWNQYVWSRWSPDAEPGFVRINSGMNSFETGALDKNACQILFTLGFPARIRQKSYEIEEERIQFLTKEGGLTEAEWKPLIEKKDKVEAALKEIAANEPSELWRLDLYTRKPTFNEQFDDIYNKWKTAKTDQEKTEQWRLANRMVLETEQVRVMEYNARIEPIREAFRLRLEAINSSFDQAMEITAKYSQILQDQYYMVPLYMENYQYLLRPNLKDVSIYKFSWGPLVFNLKYVNLE